jgi:crotonobetainyl-CoA:carnitine CoA-transferase CaiB-like acyl-CoA transferase
MSSPLDGVLVADFTRVLAGPMATMTLADLGATVIKVERVGAGDDTRTWGPPWTASSSSYFESVNRSKLSLALDLTDPGDRSLARKLASRADVLVENFLTGTMTRHGLGYEELRKVNPALVYCSITGFGSGAGADLPGYDFVIQAVGGLMSITGERDGEPLKAGVAVVDVLTGKDAVVGVLAALRARERDGRGQHVEVNLLSTLLAALTNQTGGYLATGSSPGRMGNQHPSIVPYESLRCRDGLLAVACGNDGQFGRLMQVLGRPEVAEDRRFSTNPARISHRDDLVRLLEAALTVEDAQTWERRLLAVGVPAGRVGDVAAAIARADELGLAPVQHVGDRHPPQIRHPALYSETGVAPASPPPTLDQHGAALRAWLADERPAAPIPLDPRRQS